MDSYSLPIYTNGAVGAELQLVVRTSMAAVRCGSKEPWFELDLVASGSPLKGSVALQPLSGLLSVLVGRKTAVIAVNGVLALSKKGDQVMVEYMATPDNLPPQALDDVFGGVGSVRGTVSSEQYQAMICALTERS